MTQLEIPQVVAVEREISGIEMGVLEDGTPFLTQRGLASACGLVPSAIIEQIQAWNSGTRTSELAKYLVKLGLRDNRLSIHLRANMHAVPDSVCILVIEYYAYVARNETAAHHHRILARNGLRSYIYEATGYRVGLPPGLRDFSDRLLLNRVPPGYFSVFKEMSDFLLRAIQAGLPISEHTVPDISVGIMWSQQWDENSLEQEFGPRRKYDHNYPEYYSQAASNPQPAWAYPIESLGRFRKWLDQSYLPGRFPEYLRNKVKQNRLSTSTAAKLVAAVTQERLPGAQAFGVRRSVKG